MQDIRQLLRRQDTTTNAASSSATASQTQASSASITSAASTPNTVGSSAVATASNTATSDGSAASSATGGSSGSNSGRSSSGQGSSSRTLSYANSVGYGGVSMITPAATASTSYYKVGDYITFAWNYTSLKITPSAVDIIATCTANQQTYTLAMNQTWQSTGALTWDTGEYQSTATNQLLTEKYTLIIHDAAREASATAVYGGLAAYSQFTFGMYTPQPYMPLNEGWKCVTCSGALTNAERQTLGVLLSVAALTVGSFTLFAGGWGAFI